MSVETLLRTTFLEGYATQNIDASIIFTCIFCTAGIAGYIYIIYRNISRNSFYNRNFNMALVSLAIITAAVILTIQSNIVVSLGMVGALSIVRFRTAIKDPMDLVFLFWSISVGIICGAGFALIAVVVSIVLTIAIVLIIMMPEARKSLVLAINAESYKCEDEIMEVVNTNCQYVKIRARNISRAGISLAVEVRVKDQKVLIEQLMGIESIITASLVEHDGEVTV